MSGGEPGRTAARGVAPGVVAAQRLRVLAIDDDLFLIAALRDALGRLGIDLEVTDDPRAALARIGGDAGADLDAVLLDLAMPAMDGREVLARLRRGGAPLEVVILSGAAAASDDDGLRAAGARVLAKPMRPVALAAALEAAAAVTAQRRAARAGAARPRPAGHVPPSAPALDDVLVGNDDVIRAARADLARLAASDVTVLVRGDSGTGKEIAARALHQAGPRRERPFVAVNCGAIPEALIDSELFGYHRGAFTGAAASHPGLFEQAHGGTIFLDEIGDLPVQVQARLLRVLQEGEVRPLGAPGPRAVDVRVVAATHVDLDGAVAAGRFRADLLYRLSVVTVELPPLRARRGDVPELAAHLLRRHAGAAAPRLTAAALHALTAHAWPGNVRELENALLHALALGGGDVVDLAALPPAVRAAALHDLGGGDDLAAAPAAAGLAPSATAAFREARARALAEFERGYLRDLLAETDGNVAEASRRAGLDRANLRRLLRRHDLDGRRRR